MMHGLSVFVAHISRDQIGQFFLRPPIPGNDNLTVTIQFASVCD